MARPADGGKQQQTGLRRDDAGKGGAMIMLNLTNFYPQGLKARKRIAPGEASPRAPPWASEIKLILALLLDRGEGRGEESNEP